MIDVSEKMATRRRAVAQGRIFMAPTTLKMVAERKLPKGDALALAEVAGVQAAKNTSTILPLCHPLGLDSVRVSCEAVGLADDGLAANGSAEQGSMGDRYYVKVRCEAVTTSKTGVEMEALTGVSAALLCIYDLTKGVDPVLKIDGIFLETKEGGKSGNWISPLYSAKAVATNSFGQESNAVKIGLLSELADIPVAVITISDRCSRGEAMDTSGPALKQLLSDLGALVRNVDLVADEKKQIQQAVLKAKEAGALLVLTTGGTGFGPRDVTPEALQEIFTRQIPGLGELLRAQGSRHTKMSWLSRSVAGLVGDTLVICLPGSEKAVREGFGILAPLLRHALDMICGGRH